MKPKLCNCCGAPVDNPRQCSYCKCNFDNEFTRNLPNYLVSYACPTLMHSSYAYPYEPKKI